MIDFRRAMINAALQYTAEDPDRLDCALANYITDLARDNVLTLRNDPIAGWQVSFPPGLERAEANRMASRVDALIAAAPRYVDAQQRRALPSFLNNLREFFRSETPTEFHRAAAGLGCYRVSANGPIEFVAVSDAALEAYRARMNALFLKLSIPGDDLRFAPKALDHLTFGTMRVNAQSTRLVFGSIEDCTAAIHILRDVSREHIPEVEKRKVLEVLRRGVGQTRLRPQGFTSDEEMVTAFNALGYSEFTHLKAGLRHELQTLEEQRTAIAQFKEREKRFERIERAITYITEREGWRGMRNFVDFRAIETAPYFGSAPDPELVRGRLSQMTEREMLGRLQAIETAMAADPQEQARELAYRYRSFGVLDRASGISQEERALLARLQDGGAAARAGAESEVQKIEAMAAQRFVEGYESKPSRTASRGPQGPAPDYIYDKPASQITKGNVVKVLSVPEGTDDIYVGKRGVVVAISNTPMDSTKDGNELTIEFPFPAYCSVPGLAPLTLERSHLVGERAQPRLIGRVRFPEELMEGMRDSRDKQPTPDRRQIAFLKAQMETVTTPAEQYRLIGLAEAARKRKDLVRRVGPVSKPSHELEPVCIQEVQAKIVHRITVPQEDEKRKAPTLGFLLSDGTYLHTNDIGTLTLTDFDDRVVNIVRNPRDIEDALRIDTRQIEVDVRIDESGQLLVSMTDPKVVRAQRKAELAERLALQAQAEQSPEEQYARALRQVWDQAHDTLATVENFSFSIVQSIDLDSLTRKELPTKEAVNERERIRKDYADTISEIEQNAEFEIEDIATDIKGPHESEQHAETVGSESQTGPTSRTDLLAANAAGAYDFGPQIQPEDVLRAFDDGHLSPHVKVLTTNDLQTGFPYVGYIVSFDGNTTMLVGSPGHLVPLKDVWDEQLLVGDFAAVTLLGNGEFDLVVEQALFMPQLGQMLTQSDARSEIVQALAKAESQYVPNRTNDAIRTGVHHLITFDLPKAVRYDFEYLGRVIAAGSEFYGLMVGTPAHLLPIASHEVGTQLKVGQFVSLTLHEDRQADVRVLPLRDMPQLRAHLQTPRSRSELNAFDLNQLVSQVLTHRRELLLSSLETPPAVSDRAVLRIAKNFEAIGRTEQAAAIRTALDGLKAQNPAPTQSQLDQLARAARQLDRQSASDTHGQPALKPVPRDARALRNLMARIELTIAQAAANEPIREVTDDGTRNLRASYTILSHDLGELPGSARARAGRSDTTVHASTFPTDVLIGLDETRKEYAVLPLAEIDPQGLHGPFSVGDRIDAAVKFGDNGGYTVETIRVQRAHERLTKDLGYEHNTSLSTFYDRFMEIRLSQLNGGVRVRPFTNAELANSELSLDVALRTNDSICLTALDDATQTLRYTKVPTFMSRMEMESPEMVKRRQAHAEAIKSITDSHPSSPWVGDAADRASSINVLAGTAKGRDSNGLISNPPEMFILPEIKDVLQSSQATVEFDEAGNIRTITGDKQYPAFSQKDMVVFTEFDAPYERTAALANGKQTSKDAAQARPRRELLEATLSQHNNGVQVRRLDPLEFAGKDRTFDVLRTPSNIVLSTRTIDGTLAYIELPTSVEPRNPAVHGQGRNYNRALDPYGADDHGECAVAPDTYALLCSRKAMISFDGKGAIAEIFPDNSYPQFDWKELTIISDFNRPFRKVVEAHPQRTLDQQQFTETFDKNPYRGFPSSTMPLPAVVVDTDTGDDHVSFAILEHSDDGPLYARYVNYPKDTAEIKMPQDLAVGQHVSLTFAMTGITIERTEQAVEGRQQQTGTHEQDGERPATPVAQQQQTVAHV